MDSVSVIITKENKMNRRDLFKRLLVFPVASAAGVVLGKVFPKKRHILNPDPLLGITRMDVMYGPIGQPGFQFSGAERQLNLDEVNKYRTAGSILDEWDLKFNASVSKHLGENL